MYLLDTNVLSEPTKPSPNPGVIAWLASKEARQLHVSVLTLGEIYRGIAKLPMGPKRDRLGAWLKSIVERETELKILPIMTLTALEWGRLSSAASRTLPDIDLLLAATASLHNLTVVTRNDRDFIDAGANVENPWT
jgi:predicted nucleic acid-binding protein